jgi:hypothetical protein
MAEPEQSFEERVRRRAYELWEEAGRADDFWRQARAELEGKAAERGGNPPSEKAAEPTRQADDARKAALGRWARIRRAWRGE